MRRKATIREMNAPEATPEKPLEAESALHEGTVDALVAPFYENERPLQGLAGLLDWRYLGVVSRCLKAGVVSGFEGECVYVPLIKGNHIRHLLLVGCGHLSPYKKRGQVSQKSLENLRKNIVGLKLTKVGFSRSEFINIHEENLKRTLEGVDVWMLK